MKYKSLYLLAFILLLGAFFRFYGLDKSPPSLNWDEAALGYNAYSISETGKDEYGQILPIFTRSFDDYKPGVPVYLIIPFIKIFGLNEIGVRGLSATAGTLQILLAFFISRKIFRSNWVGLFSGITIATAPFSVFFSRTMFEANVAVTIFASGILAFLYWRKRLFQFFSIGLFILSMYTYHSYKILAPITLATLLLITNLEKIPKLKYNKLVSLFLSHKKLAVFGLILLIPLVYLTFEGSGTARFKTTNLLIRWPFVLSDLLSSDLNNIGLNFLNRLLPLYFLIWELGGRYLAHFSPTNLFLKGAIENPQFIPDNSNFFPFQFILWLIGLIFIFKDFSKYKILAILILIAPLPSIINWNWFYPARAIQVFFLHSIVIGFGMYLVINYFALKIFSKISLTLKKIGLAIPFLLITIWSGFYLFESLLVLIPLFYSGNWQPGFKEAIPQIAKLEKDYDLVIIDTPQAQPYIFTLFYQSYPPKKYQSEIDYEKVSLSPRSYYDFGKYRFRDIYWPTDRNLKKAIFLGNTFNLPENDVKEIPNAKIIQDVKDHGGNILMRVVTLD